MIQNLFSEMLKFVKKKSPTSTSPQQIEISRPSNLVVSKHKLVRTDGNYILIMEDDKLIGLLDKRDLDIVAVPQMPSSPSPVSSPSASTSSYLVSNSRKGIEPPTLSSPIGTSPSKYRTLPTTFSKQEVNVPLFQWHSRDKIDDSLEDYKSTSLEHLWSPAIPTSNQTRQRAETTILQPQGSHKYDTITFAPGMSISNSSSASCNVEIHLADDRIPPPPPTRAPPVPLTMSPCQCTVYNPESTDLDFTPIHTVEVMDPNLSMSIEEVRMKAAQIDEFIQDQVKEKFDQEIAVMKPWIEQIASTVAQNETRNTIRLEMNNKKRASLTGVFQLPPKSPVTYPSDPVPNEYEKLYKTHSRPLERQSTEDSDSDIKDVRF